MIKFFRKIRQRLLSENKFSKYLIYAVGEIVLVVIGILIALQVNNWNENRIIKRTEVKYLTELSEAIDLDIIDLKSNINNSQKTIESIDLLLNHFENKLPYNDSLNIHFTRSSLFTNLITNSSVYEKLTSIGLDVISNDSLQKSIVRYYEYSSPYLRKNEEVIVNPHHNLSVRPTMIEKFSYSWLLKPAIPNSFEALQTDSAYLSLLTTTKEIIAFKQRMSKDLLKEASGLQRNIRNHLQ
ncbi:hypothetical protein G5B37_05250 [Rasiella rasia]|uniref:Uncharacterized protein n=1 Tax=Rasiella rasia TaxID=2744027 RepID=A0A6G6GKE2_9FLAO|nr:DUF6090 family protein [Rasiella rasia]QIE58987.1 hypothetical protein G5B37_05250 [Rasiella rasia]